MDNQNVYYSSKKDYDNTKDEDLIEIIKSGDKYALDYLIDRYKELVNIKVSKYYIIGAERDDIVQEGLIGLFKAIKCYKPDQQNSFKSFANMCIERQLITAIKTSNRQKHMPLNSYLSLNMSAYVENAIDKSLSGFERQVLNRYINGESYVEIAQKLDTPVKSIDNAIQRIRKKAIKEIAKE